MTEREEIEVNQDLHQGIIEESQKEEKGTWVNLERHQVERDLGPLNEIFTK